MSAPFSEEDKTFIREIQLNPAELTGWLAYADWLDERDDPRAEFIQLQLLLLNADKSQSDPEEIHKQLRELGSTLDSDWVAVFDRPWIENCEERFAEKCPEKWEQLKGTEYPLVRDCEVCRKSVRYCRNNKEIRHFLGTRAPFAVSLTIVRDPESRKLRWKFW